MSICPNADFRLAAEHWYYRVVGWKHLVRFGPSIADTIGLQDIKIVLVAISRVEMTAYLN